MQKKLIWGGLIGLAVLLGLGFGVGWHLSSNKSVDSAASQGGLVSLQAGNDSKTIPLDQSARKEASSGLSVTDAGRGQIQLPSSQSRSGNDSGSSSDQAVDFKQFEQYKTSQNTLYRDDVPGKGDEVVAGKPVALNYRGWLTTGQVFDEATAKIKPFVLIPGEHKVIPGFESGIIGMKVGGKRLLIIPPALGYGSQAIGPIPEDSVLIFEIEVLKVG